MKEEQRELAKEFFEAANKVPEELRSVATSYLQGMAAAAKLIKGAQETGAA